jgi:GNAT superfamily N-acetyltransferase
MITIRRATLADKDAIFRFIQQVHADRWQYKIPERWQWEFVDNPFLKDDRLPIWIALDELGNVVGQACSLVEPLKIGNQIRRVGWGVDVFLLPDHRGQGTGYQLNYNNDQDHEIFLSLSMSKTIRRIKAGAGSVSLDPVPSYTRLLRFTPESLRTAVVKRLGATRKSMATILDKGLRWTLADRMAAGLLNLWQGLRDRQQLGTVDKGIRIIAVDRFGPEVNTFWEKVSHFFYAIIERKDGYLNWKYIQQPFVHYQKCMAMRKDDIVGYIIFRLGSPPERNVGIIADLLAAPDEPDTIRALYSYAIKWLKIAGAKDLLTATSVKAYQECLESLGFKKTREDVPMLHCKIEGLDCDRAHQPGSWFLGKGDHDWDQFPLAR